jgi:hypothetical protein
MVLAWRYRFCMKFTQHLLIGAAACAGAALAHAGPHEHGVADVTVTLEGPALAVNLRSPLDNFLGFERAPRTDAERRAATALLAQLEAAAFVQPPAAAQCVRAAVSVSAPVLQASGAAAAAAGKTGHADVQAELNYRCAQPQALRNIELDLFSTWPRLKQVRVQTATPQGQHASTLRRPAKVVVLAR